MWEMLADQRPVSNVVMGLHYRERDWCVMSSEDWSVSLAIMALVMITGHVLSCHLDRCQHTTNHQAAGNTSGQYGRQHSHQHHVLTSVPSPCTLYTGPVEGRQGQYCVSCCLIAKSDLIWVCRKVVCLQQVSSVRECHNVTSCHILTNWNKFPQTTLSTLLISLIMSHPFIREYFYLNKTSLNYNGDIYLLTPHFSLHGTNQQTTVILVLQCKGNLLKLSKNLTGVKEDSVGRCNNTLYSQLSKLSKWLQIWDKLNIFTYCLLFQNTNSTIASPSKPSWL